MALAPAIAALAGIGATALWRIRHTWTARVILAGTLLVTAAWAWVLLDRSPGWFPWLKVVIGVAAAAAAAMILAGPALRAATARGRTALAIAPLSLALVAGLGGPLAYSIDTAATAHGGSIPTAGPTVAGSSGGPGGGGRDRSRRLRRPGRAASPGRDVRDRPGRDRTGPGERRRPWPEPSRRVPAEPRRSRRRAAPVGAGGPGGTGSVSSALSRLLESGASGYQVGGGHDQLHQRGLARAGQQRGPGHGDRRLHRQ